MSTHLPRDDNRLPIPVLSPLAAGAHDIDAITTESRTAGPFAAATRVILIQAEVAIRYALGDETVTAAADGHYLSAGVPMPFSLGGVNRATHIAVRADAEDGTVHISELV